MPQATLRTWEARYGVPQPRRLPGGHRRYGEDDVALVEEILRRRASGLSLSAAISGAGLQASAPEGSIFAGLRRRYPELQPQVLSKNSLLALSRAIEDECCARAERPVLFVSFQRRQFYRSSKSRWLELARTAKAVVVFADFVEPPVTGSFPLEVAVPAAAPLRREWALVCDAPDYPVCLTGWEHPGQDESDDAHRRFETLWTVDPVVVRAAAQICLGLMREYTPDQAALVGKLLDGIPAPASSDLERATSLLGRMIGYLEAARR